MDCLRSCYEAFSPSKRAGGSVAHNGEPHYTPTDDDGLPLDERIIHNGTEFLKSKIQGFIDVQNLVFKYNLVLVILSLMQNNVVLGGNCGHDVMS